MGKLNVAVLMPDSGARRSFIPADVARELEGLFRVKWNDTDAELSGGALSDFLADADIALTGWGSPKLDAAAISKATRLKMLMHTGGTVAPYVSGALYDANVVVISGNKMFAESVAEGTVAYMLSGLRWLPMMAERMQRGIWKAEDDETEGLLDQVVGLVGLGAIPRYLIPMLKPFRVRIMGYDPYVDRAAAEAMGIEKVDDLGQLFEKCKIVSLHLPRTEKTHHMIDGALLSRLQDGALLINTSRGAVVDEAAMEDQLISGRIRAVLDVYQTEPLKADSRLRGLNNVILMPHVAGPTKDRHAYITRALIADAQNYFAGSALVHEISREYALSMTDDRLKL